jgi:hypothetical protein
VNFDHYARIRPGHQVQAVDILSDERGKLSGTLEGDQSEMGRIGLRRIPHVKKSSLPRGHADI